MGLAEGLPFGSPAGKRTRQSHSRSALLLAEALQCATRLRPIASLCLDRQPSLASYSTLPDRSMASQQRDVFALSRL